MFNKSFLCLLIISTLLFTGCIIRGRIVGEYGAPLAGVNVALTGSASMTTTTDSNGYYQFGTLENMLSAGSYTVTPLYSGYSITPTSRNVSFTTQTLEGLGDVSMPASGVDFEAICNDPPCKVGAEFRVNTYTTDEQDDPSVADLSNGGFVVIWKSKGQDGSGDSVYGQLYNSLGNKVGSEFRVNSHTTDDQDDPSVAGLSNGGFIVIWESKDQDGSGEGVYGQQYDSSGNKISSEFRVNTYTAGGQINPSVAGLINGGFVVTWDSDDQDGSGDGVYGQLHNSLGNKVGSEFRVNSHTTDDQDDPSVAGLSNGGFVVIWESKGQDGSGEGVYGQQYDSSGNKISSEFRVNTYTADDQINPSVAGLINGGFVVTWDSDDQDGSGDGVYEQLFKSNSEIHVLRAWSETNGYA